MTTREQGDLGEASAIEWLTFQGATVAVPLFNSPDWDLVAEIDGRLARVQVKTSGLRTPKGYWQVRICTRGGNQSWNGVAKYFSPARCDYLFALVADGRRWYIPAQALDGRSSVTLGGPKYAEFEVVPGARFPRERCRNPRSTIANRIARRDVRVVKGDRL